MSRSRLVVTMAATVAFATIASAACGDGSPKPITPANDAGNDGGSLCLDGKPTAPYPPGPYEVAILGTVPGDLVFDGAEGPVRIADYFEPCAPRSRVLVVRTSAAWCGSCRWHSAHTTRFMSPARADRLRLLDLLVADEDNLPATLASLPKWRETIDAPRSGALAIDPSYTFRTALLSRAPLPEYVFIDTRTMKILSSLDDPDPESLVTRIDVELADLDKTPRPEEKSPTLSDGFFTENEMDLIRGMKLVSTPPPDPTNEYADAPAAVAFGKTLFSDGLLSPSGNISCAKCHDPGLDMADGVPQSTGVAKVDRNSPGVALSAHSRWQFWDGRADTLWMQALLPFEDAREFASSRLFVAHQIVQRYPTEYAATFSKYPLPALTGLPAAGKPGDAAYDALSATDKDNVTRVFVNVGKAIAAFERAMRVKPNALDRYIDGDTGALTRAQKNALSLFMKNGCVQCHWGPRLTDDAFHALRFETGRQDSAPDEGREAGLAKLAAAEFLASSKWSDAPSAAKAFPTSAPTMLGAFKTPTLRGLPTSAPYGHGGKLATLLDVTTHYGDRGLEHADPRAVGTTEQWVPNFDTNAKSALVPILEALTGTVEVP
jgi:cytochrome c peroxidase